MPDTSMLKQTNIKNVLINWKETLTSLALIVICLLLFYFFPAKGNFQAFSRSLFFLVIIPALYIIFILEKSLKDFGLNFPIDREALLWFATTLIFSLVLGLFIVKYTSLKTTYSISGYAVGNFGWFLFYELVLVNLFLFLYEAFFKGFLLFIFAEKLGWRSIFISALFFASFLILTGDFSWQNAPIIITALPGFVLAYKTRSFIYSHLMELLFIIMLDAYIIYSLR